MPRYADLSGSVSALQPTVLGSRPAPSKGDERRRRKRRNKVWKGRWQKRFILKNLSRTCFLRLSTVSTQKRLHIWQKRFGLECLATFGDTTLGQQGHAVTCLVQLLKIYSIVLAMRCPETKSPLIISPLTRRLLTKCLQTVTILFTCLPSLRCTQTRGAITKYQFANCQLMRSLFIHQ